MSLLGRVQLSAATTAVVSGLRLAMAQSWLLALVTLAVLGKITDALIGVVERRLLRRW